MDQKREIITCSHCGGDNKTNSKYCVQCGYELPKMELVENTVQQSKRTVSKGWRKSAGKVVVFVIAFVCSYFIVRQFFSGPSFDRVSITIANELNKTCPVMVDESTRLDNVAAMPDNVFQYNYTLINLEKSQVNRDTLKKYIAPGIVNGVKTDPSLKEFRKHKTILNYNYRDKNGMFLLKISVTPEMYE